jgi:uncharacterized protein (TIGR02001 family)
MKKLLVALMLASGFAAYAQVTGNMTITSDYRFRGVSQTQNASAIQGGVDYSNANGLYVGNWNSSVSSQLYTNGAGMESDLYAGVKKEVMKDVTLDVGSMNYFYPRATTSTSSTTNFDTNELYGGLSYKDMITTKYSQSVSNYFGTANSKNSKYIQADVTLPIAGKLVAVAHAGRTNVANSASLNYTDYNAGVVYDLQGWAVAAKYYTNTSKGSGFQSANTVNSQKLYKDLVVLSVSKSF